MDFNSKSHYNTSSAMNIFKRKSVIIILILLFIFGGYLFVASKKKKSEVIINLKTAKTSRVQKGKLSKYLTLAGKIDAKSFANLQFQTSGLMAWVGVKEGDSVKKYQAIASLDKTQLKKQFEKEMNDYLTNRWNFEDTQDKYKPLKERYLITDEFKRILERTQFSLNNAVLDLEISDLAVKYATLISPISGIVTHIDQPNAGVNIIPAGAAFTIIDPTSIYFKSNVNEIDVPLIKEGQTTSIILDAFPQNIIDSKIENIAFTPVEGETSTTYKVSFTLPVDNSSSDFRVGMNGNAQILLETLNDTLYLPFETIQEENVQKFVYIKNSEGKIEKVLIKTGLETDDYIQIIEGLFEGSEVIYNAVP